MRSRLCECARNEDHATRRRVQSVGAANAGCPTKVLLLLFALRWRPPLSLFLAICKPPRNTYDCSAETDRDYRVQTHTCAVPHYPYMSDRRTNAPFETQTHSGERTRTIARINIKLNSADKWLWSCIAYLGVCTTGASISARSGWPTVAMRAFAHANTHDDTRPVAAKVRVWFVHRRIAEASDVNKWAPGLRPVRKHVCKLAIL